MLLVKEGKKFVHSDIFTELTNINITILQYNVNEKCKNF